MFDSNKANALQIFYKKFYITLITYNYYNYYNYIYTIH